MESKNLLDLIEKINLEFFNNNSDVVISFLEECPETLLELKSIGYAHAINFLNYPIWSSENEERPFINENTPEEDYMPLEQWLRQEIKRILFIIKQINLED